MRDSGALVSKLVSKLDGCVCVFRRRIIIIVSGVPQKQR